MPIQMRWVYSSSSFPTDVPHFSWMWIWFRFMHEQKISRFIVPSLALALFTPCHLTIIDQIHVKRYGIDEFFPSTVPFHSADFAKIISYFRFLFSFQKSFIVAIWRVFFHQKWNWRVFPLDRTRSQSQLFLYFVKLILDSRIVFDILISNQSWHWN